MYELYDMLIIAAIIQIITLIVFFIMANNVSKIKKILRKEFSFDEYIEMSNEELYVGNTTKAKELLLRAEYPLQKVLKRIELDTINEYESEKKEIAEKMKKIQNLLNRMK